MPSASAEFEEIARALSGHRFDAALPHLADDVSGTLVGGETLLGREAVAAACRQTADALAGATTEFERFRSIAAGDSVVVDTLARYTEADGSVSVVASCDLYDFVDGRISEIVSYTVEFEG